MVKMKKSESKRPETDWSKRQSTGYVHPAFVKDKFVILAKPFKHPKTGKPTIDATGWWLSEKLDGIRAIWDAKEGELFTRSGKLILAPDWFLDYFPKDINLDGELFLGYGNDLFNKMSGIARRIPIKSTGKPSTNYKPEEWVPVKYMVFDAHDYPGPYEERVKAYTEAVEKMGNDCLIAVKTWKAKSNADVDIQRQKIEDLGGEGIMLRKPESKYERKRSSTLLKEKSWLDDEAVVIGHNPGTGKYNGMLGSLQMKMPNGTEFDLSGMDDALRRNPPAIGSLVTYKYFELTKDGIPRFPSFIGIRHDL